MFKLFDVISNFVTLKKGKAKEIVIGKKGRVSPRYGNELLCARYYNEDESHYIDLYVPLKGPLGVWMSGGADSSMLAFLLAKTIKDYNLDVKILPMSFKRDDKPWNMWVATNIVERIEEILDIKKGEIFLNHNYCYFGDYKSKEFLPKLRKHVESLKDNKLITICYTGLTKNPEDIPEDMIESREFSRDEPAKKILEEKDEYKEELIISIPFLFQDKKFIAGLYNKLGLMEKLFPYTRSCENVIHNTDFFKTSCGKCWWCKERKWAFGSYTKDPLKHIQPSNKIIRSCVAV